MVMFAGLWPESRYSVHVTFEFCIVLFSIREVVSMFVIRIVNFPGRGGARRGYWYHRLLIPKKNPIFRRLRRRYWYQKPPKISPSWYENPPKFSAPSAPITQCVFKYSHKNWLRELRRRMPLPSKHRSIFDFMIPKTSAPIQSGSIFLEILCT